MTDGFMIGKRIRRYRQIRGIKLKDVTEITGISVSYLSKVETGRIQEPGIYTVSKIAEALSTSVSTLVGDSEMGDKLYEEILKRELDT